MIKKVFNVATDVNSESLARQEEDKLIFKIQTSPILLTLADALKLFIEQKGFAAKVITKDHIDAEIKYSENNLSNDYFIFLVVGHCFNIPSHGRYIIYNLEQVNYYRDFPCFGMMGERAEFLIKAYNNCLQILDYSEANMNKYPSTIQNKPMFFDIPLVPSFPLKFNSNKECDILFVGSMNERRYKILKALKQQKFNIRVLSHTYGDDLYECIGKAMVLLNIHSKTNSNLEIARLHDYLRRHHVKIVSEETQDCDTMEKYKKLVQFTPIIEDNGKNFMRMVDHIKNLINKNIDFNNREKWIRELVSKQNQQDTFLNTFLVKNL